MHFLAGAEINIDALLPSEASDYRTQALLVSRNPYVAAKFFNIYIKAFIKFLLGFDKYTRRPTDEGGVLDHVKAHFGCVEAQGRGTLHCHMIVWLEGGLNPNKIRDRVVGGDSEFASRLIRFLDESITTSIPESPESPAEPNSNVREMHPSALRGVDLTLSEPEFSAAHARNIYRLASLCQHHKHSQTCYKYCKDGKQECRFDLAEENTCAISTFDFTTSELRLRCIDGLVNNFNMIMLEAIRCNMDIKFIGSGDAAKAILYYITDYITKTQLKVHAAFATLELAVKKLDKLNINKSESVLRAKRLLQKCAIAMLTHQELSAPLFICSLVNFELFFPVMNLSIYIGQGMKDTLSR